MASRRPGGRHRWTIPSRPNRSRQPRSPSDRAPAPRPSVRPAVPRFLSPEWVAAFDAAARRHGLVGFSRLGRDFAARHATLLRPDGQKRAA